MTFSKRSDVDPFIVMEVMKAAAARAAAGGDVLHMEVGQPGTPAPRLVREAAKAAIDSQVLGYSDALGLPALRESIAGHYRETYGVDVGAERIAVTTGSSGAFLLAFLALFDHGERIALGRPCYPAYRNILRALGIEVVDIPVGPDSRFQPTVAHLDAVEGPLKGLLVASPANPTGTMLELDDYRALSAACRARGMRLISDEIYHGITYERPAVTALAVDPSAIVVNSFSKYFSMTGWRVGWMVLPPDMVRPIERLAQSFYISVPVVSQWAALAAFSAREELEANVAAYARNRAVLLEALPKAGFDRLAPADGAFYIYADVSRHTNSATDFCKEMLAEIGVAATPGTDFDPVDGESYVRFSFAGAEPEIAEAARRIVGWPRLRTAGRG
ncbi:pyridoxal phosphate-dependent aminotransferase [Oceanibacterium hippocampi]|uniref:Aminotransferase n=1 Tax=Oceanibacterium hippocampi TaxID=745714 RepID=A0A1Y5SV35_9PROT|nr:aminotransferase class I/II-fold pyridoxal phosphate-dependent enzyme [Oceanibacterium hippocampi]SLN48975.1 Putative N-acetyl-LL-diaminopimelate aminotransferase [Oceanibacterium hippocampi]